MHKTAIIIGASGLVGSNLLEILLAHKGYGNVICIVRNPLSIAHEKLEQRIIDFNDADAYKNAFEKVDAIFACVGTTQKNVMGDKEAYRKIDFDINVNAAKYGSILGVEQFHLVSAIGANSSKGNFYIRLKGEVEDAVKKYVYKSIHIYQPSLLIGKRNEKRSGEGIAQTIMPWFNWMFMGSLKKYHTIKAEEVALAMCNASLKNTTGINTYDYAGMQKLLK
jgi:NAD(P)-dependent dehydrogenase (short-subunit alcohol dehydrogenase family)